MITDRAFKFTVTCLLAGILVVLAAICVKMPRAAPTIGDLRRADEKTARELRMRRPLVYVDGNVSVDGTVDIGYMPDVDIDDTPALDVRIVR